MANRRTLKKEISRRILNIGYCYLAINDCNAEKRSGEAVATTIAKLSQIHHEFISRVNHTDPGNAKKYYQRLKKDFKAALEGVVLPEIDA